ncbi:MAG: RibD family protein [Microcoleaceae cyanobacterium]
MVLATSADGKITDWANSPARFGSKYDKAHLEEQVAQADAVLFGRATLDAYGTTLRVTTERLLCQRRLEGKPDQPIQIVCSGSARLDLSQKFFRQPVPRWLLTTNDKTDLHQSPHSPFERILVTASEQSGIDWLAAMRQLKDLGLHRLAVLGGGQLVGSLMDLDLIDEFWLTICPLILGSDHAPTPVTGNGFLAETAPRLRLLNIRQIDQEIFLHYQVRRD